jgi:hypothetical protein
MKEVDPFAAILRGVLRLSSKVATNRNVTSGHQPGKGKRIFHTATPQKNAAAVISATKAYNRV